MTNYKQPITDDDCKNLIDFQIGEGTRRIVYSVKNNPNVIIKEMKNIFPGSNMYEHFLWNFMSSTKLSNVFGKCFTISESGKYLIMEYLRQSQDTGIHTTPETLHAMIRTFIKTMNPKRINR